MCDFSTSRVGHLQFTWLHAQHNSHQNKSKAIVIRIRRPMWNEFRDRKCSCDQWKNHVYPSCWPYLRITFCKPSLLLLVVFQSTSLAYILSIHILSMGQQSNPRFTWHFTTLHWPTVHYRNEIYASSSLRFSHFPHIFHATYVEEYTQVCRCAGLRL